MSMFVVVQLCIYLLFPSLLFLDGDILLIFISMMKPQLTYFLLLTLHYYIASIQVDLASLMRYRWHSMMNEFDWQRLGLSGDRCSKHGYRTKREWKSGRARNDGYECGIEQKQGQGYIIKATD